MNRRLGLVVQLFLSLAYDHAYDWHGFVVFLLGRLTEKDSTLPLFLYHLSVPGPLSTTSAQDVLGAVGHLWYHPVSSVVPAV